MVRPTLAPVSATTLPVGRRISRKEVNGQRIVSTGRRKDRYKGFETPSNPGQQRGILTSLYHKRGRVRTWGTRGICMERIHTFVECGWSLWTLHGMSHIVYGGAVVVDGNQSVAPVTGTGPMDFGKDSGRGLDPPLDLDDDDPKIFVSRRSASSDK